jgi:transposase
MLPSYEELQTQVILLTQQLKQVLAENQALKTEIRELKEKLNTNSTNSSTPPSQDPFKKIKKKENSGKPKGGQAGHKGYSRHLFPLSQVQIVHELKPSSCPGCSSIEFDKVSISTEIRQVVELPEMPPQVTQYNIHTCRCSKCKKHVKADIPKEAKYGFGPRLMGFITSLSGEFRISRRQVTALMGKLGIRVCSGSVCKIHERASEILKTPYDEIKEHVLSQEHLNGDETHWKTLGKKRWIWISLGTNAVFLQITASRSAQAFQDVFRGFSGILTTDRYDGYNTHKGLRQLCWAHAIRDFKKIAERAEVDAWIGNRLQECSKELFHHWHRFCEGVVTREELIKTIETGVKEKVRMLLKLGAIHQDCDRRTLATCFDFFDRFDSLWLFLYHENVEPTNNAAERGLRHGVIWRKLCYGSQSEGGERFIERVMTVAGTLKLQAKNSFEYFTDCFRAYIYEAQAPPVCV